MRLSSRSLIVVLVAGVGCNSRTDTVTAVSTSATSVSTLSITLQPSSVVLRPGSSAFAIATIRDAMPGAVESAIVGVPNGVSARVTSATTTDSVATKKYIFIADGAAVPGTYGLTVRVTVPGRPRAEVPLELVISNE